ncbi:MAG: hypothetical protein ABI743_13470, partial [bacterium]
MPPHPAWGTADGPLLELITRLPLTAESGSVLTCSVRITPSSGTAPLSEHFELPIGWAPLLTPTTFEVGSVPLAHPLALQIPGSAPAGDYSFIYALENAQHERVASILVPVTLRAHPAARFETTEAPPSVVAGRTWNSTVVLRNTGNLPLSLDLVAELPDQGYRATLVPDHIDAPPGTAVILELTVATRTDEIISRSLSVTLTARRTDEPDAAPIASKILTTQIIPTRSATRNLHLTMPSEATLRVSAEDGEARVQGELSGRGPITEDGDTEVDFIVRHPDTQNESSFGRRDLDHLALTTPDYSLQLGDGRYDLSTLTTRGFKEDGIGFEWHPEDGEDLILGGFYAQGNGRDDRAIGAAYARQRLSEALSLQWNSAVFFNGDPGEHDTQIHSLGASGKLPQHWSYALEAATG